MSAERRLLIKTQQSTYANRIRTTEIFRFVTLAQRRHRDQWGLSEMRLLLVENFIQFPGIRAWNMAVESPISGQDYGPKL